MLTCEERKAVLRGDPIMWNGLTLFPVKVADYELFSAVKMSITAVHQTMPPQYVSMRYLEALYAMEADGQAAGTGPGLFGRLLLLLTLAFQLPAPKEGSLEALIPMVKRNAPHKLVSLLLRQGDAAGEITPQNFDHLRELLAEQNGIVLPDESENADFLESERQPLERASLQIDFESLLYSVALASHTQPEEIFNWTIRKFSRMEAAADRSKGYLIAALTEGAGSKYKNGNPYPSWRFDRELDLQGPIQMDSFAGRLRGAVHTDTP